MGPEPRIANIQDLKIIQALNQKLCALEQKKYDKNIRIEYPLEEEAANALTKKIKQGSVWIVEVNENNKKRAIGYLSGGLLDVTYNSNVIAELDTMYIEGAFRGRGIGTDLMKLFSDFCLEKGVDQLRVSAWAGNTNAIAFYQKAGYAIGGVTLFKKLL